MIYVLYLFDQFYANKFPIILMNLIGDTLKFILGGGEVTPIIPSHIVWDKYPSFNDRSSRDCPHRLFNLDKRYHPSGLF